MSAAAHRYSAYGLRIRSEIALPLSAAPSEREPDVRIRNGAVPETLAVSRTGRRNWEAAPGLFRLEVEGVARYLVREGREIVVDRAGDDDTAVVPFLLGSVLAACLQQRGVLTLHASAMATGGGAVLFAGHSGLGKSTLLAAVVDRGYAMLSDDVTGIVAEGDGGDPRVLPAFPSLRLWSDAVEALGWEGRTQGRVREGVEKYLVPVERGVKGPLPVRAVFVLTIHNRDGIEMETVPTASAFEYLARCTYRKRYASGLGRGREHFRMLAALAGGIPVVRVARPLRGLPIAELADRIEGCLRAGWPARAKERPLCGGGRPARAGGVTAPGAEASAGSIVWLASYPRSGNTWLRALLTNYLDEGGGPASIDALGGGSGAGLREAFDEELGLSSSDLTPEEILRHRPHLHELLAAELPRPSFVKVHEACLRTADGALLFPPAATLGAVYVVRNPLDVAVSTAHFWNRPIARAVADLNRPEVTLASSVRGIHYALPQPLLTWSGHVASWIEQRELPVQVVRYEDLLADTGAAFGAVLRFAGLEPEAARLARAVEHARFDRLRAQEERSGFREKPPTARFFFRSGRAGAWRESLSREQVRTLVDAHAPLMERFGYLREAEAFLSDGDGAGSGLATGAHEGPAREGPKQRRRRSERQ